MADQRKSLRKGEALFLFVSPDADFLHLKVLMPVIRCFTYSGYLIRSHPVYNQQEQGFSTRPPRALP
jgi:hypothetical protein